MMLSEHCLGLPYSKLPGALPLLHGCGEVKLLSNRVISGSLTDTELTEMARAAKSSGDWQDGITSAMSCEAKLTR